MFVFVSLVDLTSIGRFNKDLMSQQTLMEFLVENLNLKSLFLGAEGLYKDISGWEHVKCNANGEVESINWDSGLGENMCSEPKGGSLDLQWIPSTAKDFYISELGLCGSVDTSQLTQELCRFDISGNRFEGNFETEDLPRGLTLIFLFVNELTGSLNLTVLPPPLKHFWASENRFSGSLHFDSLPTFIESVYLDSNRFSGQIELFRLPRSLMDLTLEDNFLQQAELVIRSDMFASLKITLDGSKFPSIVDEDGNDSYVYLEKNE